MQLLAERNEAAILRGQAERLHELVSGLLRRYQSRDRTEICCHGVSVAQCYALEVTAARDGLTMGELAADQQVAVSTMSRIVDHLVARGLVERRSDGADRRVLRVFVTEPGRRLLTAITGELIAAETEVLAGIEVEHRPSVLKALEALLAATEARLVRAREKGGCCDV